MLQQKHAQEDGANRAENAQRQIKRRPGAAGALLTPPAVARVFVAIELVTVLANLTGQGVADMARGRSGVIVKIDGGHPRAVFALQKYASRCRTSARRPRDDGNCAGLAQVGAVAATVGSTAAAARTDGVMVALVTLHVASDINPKFQARFAKEIQIPAMSIPQELAAFKERIEEVLAKLCRGRRPPGPADPCGRPVTPKALERWRGRE